MSRTRSILVLGALFALGCGAEPPAAVPAQPSLPPNRPPSVAVQGGSCHPSTDRPCTVTLDANATDPDGDPVAFLWSGCAGGTDRTTTCVVSEPGSHAATVVVRDVWGASATASAQAVGVNTAPTVVYVNVPTGRLAKNALFWADGRVWDADGDEDILRVCREMAVRTTGPCGVTLFCQRDTQCNHAFCGVIAEFGIEIRTTSPNGDCIIDASVADGWGERASARLTYYVD